MVLPGCVYCVFFHMCSYKSRARGTWSEHGQNTGHDYNFGGVFCYLLIVLIHNMAVDVLNPAKSDGRRYPSGSVTEQIISS
jgi:hypothetical protein